MKRIAISGKACSGKSTIANYLVEHYGFVELTFASKLKDVVEDLFGRSKNGKNREKLQAVGEMMRRIHSYVWIIKLFNRIPNNENVVVSDARYLNEIVSLKEAGFTTIRVEIDKKIQRKRYQALYGKVDDDTLNHMSEIALDEYDGFDYVLDGALPKDALQKSLDGIIVELNVGDVKL